MHKYFSDYEYGAAGKPAGLGSGEGLSPIRLICRLLLIPGTIMVWRMEKEDRDQNNQAGSSGGRGPLLWWQYPSGSGDGCGKAPPQGKMADGGKRQCKRYLRFEPWQEEQAKVLPAQHDQRSECGLARGRCLGRGRDLRIGP